MIKPGEDTRAIRQMRFMNQEEIIGIVPQLKEYIYEAIEVENAGLKIEKKIFHELVIPVELQKHLDLVAELKVAFFNLTPGRRREYAEYVSQAKLEKTRVQRVEKIISMILGGKGLNDRYRRV